MIRISKTPSLPFIVAAKRVKRQSKHIKGRKRESRLKDILQDN